VSPDRHGNNGQNKPSPLWGSIYDQKKIH
jgi:hypothetical protein